MKFLMDVAEAVTFCRCYQELYTIKVCALTVTRDSLQDLSKQTRPALIVKDVIETVAMLIGPPENKWEKLKRLIGSSIFLEKIQRLNLDRNISKDQFTKLRERLANPEFDEEFIKTICVPVVPLATWCRAIGVYLSKTKYQGGPEIQQVAAAAAAPSPPRRTQTSAGKMLFDPDLDRLSVEELRRVRGLTISRPDVGQIVFHGETDCTELNFDQIVRLDIGEVLVYPDARSKPAVGVGLNKPATVTMYECWPPAGSKLASDPKAQERYKKKIENMTEEKHAKFIDYDCNTGIWKFAVDHF